jgi:hypothetical protein
MMAAPQRASGNAISMSLLIRLARVAALLMSQPRKD